LERAESVVQGLLAGGSADPEDSLLLAGVHSHDEATFYHSVNVCLLSLAIGRAAGLGDPDLLALGTGALLHDIGRVLLDDPALHCTGALTSEQWDLVKLHPQEGAAAIMAVAGPGRETAAVVALEHHLRLDGGGYPDLPGRRPHLFSRIVAIADGYDAMTSHRPHRSARTPQEALQMVLEESGSGYDPDLVTLFARMMGRFPPGSLLRLDSGETVVVTAGGGGICEGVVVRDVAGLPATSSERIVIDPERVAAQLPPDALGIGAAVLVGDAEQDGPDTP